MFVLNFPAFENKKKYAAYDTYGEIPTRKEPIRTRGFALPYNKLGSLPTDIIRLFQEANNFPR